MKDYHGIIFAYSVTPGLRDLTAQRNSASLPFCGRYRLIDFSLSSLSNAGIKNVGVIMQRDYQSLLDHLTNGKSWDMSLSDGGLRLLPPFGLPAYHRGDYGGTIEALNKVATYIKDVPQKNVILMQGNVCANIDLAAAIAAHEKSGDEITAICTDVRQASLPHCYTVGDDSTAGSYLYDPEGTAGGVITSLEAYIVRKDTLVKMMDACRSRDLHRFHRDAVISYLGEGGKIGIYMHKGYTKSIRTAEDYFTANMDMLDNEKLRDLFTPSRPVRTRQHEGVSTYYGENAVASNCLIADNCIIEGSVENCVIFSGARIDRGAKLTNCIVMRNCTVGAWAELRNVILDKNVSVEPGSTLLGSPKLPTIVPKGSDI